MHEKTETTSSLPGPLDGVRVVELGTSVAAPYGCWVLAALGAEVIKVERPAVGDDARHWGPPFWHGTSTMFQAYNRDKKSLVVNLKDPDELARFRRYLVENVDVVMQNLRPGVVESLGLDAGRLTAESPRLVYCNIWAYGAVGPLRQQPGYDPLMQAFGGLMSVNGEPGRPPSRIGTSIVDVGTGMWCVIGILSLLRQRELTGHGGVVDASLLETSLAWMTYHVADYNATGANPVPQGSGVRGIAPYQAYACSDGYLVVAAPNDRLFARLASVLGHPEWTDDARFSSNPLRFENMTALNAVMMPIFESDSRAAWQERLSEKGIPSAPLKTVDEVLENEQVRSLGILQTSEPNGMETVGLPLRFGGRRPPQRNEAPSIGDFNDAFEDEMR